MSAATTEIPRDRFLAFAFAGADLLVEATAEGVIGFAAGAFQARLGIPPERAVGEHVTWLVAPADRAQLGAALARLGARCRIRPMVLRLNNATRTPASIAGVLLPGTPPRLCLTVGQVPLASTDAPPDGFDPRGLQSEAEARLRDGIPGAISLIELTGWLAARESIVDASQRELLEAIRAALTEEQPGAPVSEIADGRFAVLTTRPDHLLAMVQRLEALLGRIAALRKVRVRASFLPLQADGLDPLRAARALRYTLSQFGQGGPVAVQALGAEGGLRCVLAEAEERARGLRAAIAARRFQLRFQPVVSLATRKVHHFESLLRPFGIVGSVTATAQDFVTFVEAVGLSEDLDCAVTEQVLAALRASSNVAIAVNISGLSLESPAFCDRFLSMLDGSPGLVRGRLLAELTETAEIELMEAAAAGIARIRSAGVPMCLDDFGTGLAAFRYLREFRFDFVKIDGVSVHRALQGGRERGFVTAMVELADAVGARVVAEMIETDAQAELMRSLGVEFGQGFLLGRPQLLPGTGR